jgi:hypothetical protein
MLRQMCDDVGSSVGCNGIRIYAWCADGRQKNFEIILVLAIHGRRRLASDSAGKHLLKKSALVCEKPGRIDIGKDAQNFSSLFKDFMFCSGWSCSPYQRAHWAYIPDYQHADRFI